MDGFYETLDVRLFVLSMQVPVETKWVMRLPNPFILWLRIGTSGELLRTV
jgi:hypothetical protein